MNNNIRVKRLLKIFLLLIILQLSQSVAQNRQLLFERILSEDSPSQSLISSIYQDTEGFLWFGTQDGLYKYDGYNFTAFRNRAFDSTSISDNYIQAIVEDKQGNIWAGTQTGGISKYDKISGSFTNYRHNAGDQNSLINNRVWSLFEDSGGDIWIGTSGGLDRLDVTQNKFTHYFNQKANGKNLYNYAVNAIYEDASGILWLGTFGAGLISLDLKSVSGDNRPIYNSYTFNYSPKVNFGLNRIKKIYEDKQNNLWLATYAGLIKFDRDNKTYKIFFLENPGHDSQNGNALLTIMEDHKGKMWVGTHDSGLCLFDKAKGSFTKYGKNLNYKNSISDQYVTSLLEDNTGILWVGTGKGINKVLPYYQNFINLSFNPSDPKSISADEINSIYEDSYGDIWIGTWQGGLNKYNKKNMSFVSFKFKKDDPGSIPDNTVWAICEDKNKNLVIGTYSGLSKFDRKTGKFTRNYLKEAGLVHKNISAIFHDRYGDLWVGTYGDGLSRLRSGRKKIIHYQFDPGKTSCISDNFITKIFEDKEGNLWIGTHAGGLNLFDRDKNNFTCFQYNPKDKTSLSNNNIRCIAQDSFGNMWIGTWGGGLNLFDKTNKKFIHFNEKSGLVNNVVFGILEDNSGNLWISTNKGLSKLNIKSKKIINFQEEDGIGSEQFSYGYLKSKDGLMYFGGANGLTIFDPDSIVFNNNIPPVVITAVKKYNETINFKKEILENNKILISYYDNEFSIDFAALDYTRPAKNCYAYKLVDYDKDWNYSQNTHSARYTHLEPGVYEFKVKASNNNKIGNEKGTSIFIEIVPPYWDTIWFKTLGVILFILAIYLIFKIRVRSIAARNEMLQNLVHERTNKLESEILVRQKAEKALKKSEEELKVINANKDKFFSIISHDLKSPFFALLGYGTMLETDFDVFSKNELKKLIMNMNKLILRLSNLTENLLQWSKVQTGRIDFTPNNIELGELIEQPLSLLTLTANGKNINIENNVDTSIKVYVDTNMINSVIQNLITNAIKFTKPGGKIVLNSEKNNDFVEVTVKDNGIGMNKEILSRLFKIEAQFSTKGTNEEMGSGLGLILCKEFVEKNGGNISVESVEKEGTVFRFTMPLAK